MKNSAAISLIVGAACMLAGEAFADAQTIDFSCILEHTLNNLTVEMPVPWHEAAAIDWTAQGGVGIPDVEEFELLSLILADPDAPNHDAIHTAFATNASLARTAMGSTIVGLTTSHVDTGPNARQPIPGTDPQEYYGADGLLGAYITLGEWDFCAETMQAWKDSAFGTYVTVPTGSEGYVLRDDLGMCGDVDGDGVSNSSEYWSTSPHSWAGALNVAVTDAGATWDVWACAGQPGENPRFWYNETTQRVYTMTVAQLTWAEAVDFELAWPNGIPIAVTLCTIRNEEENEFVADLANGYDAWIGCTDAGRDIGHTAPNPEDWYWLSDVTQSPMTYTNWSFNNPTGVDGAQDCGTMDGFGEWDDMSEFSGSPPEPRRYPAVFELTTGQKEGV
ncbi:MAG: lectin-like protein [Candidatus Hydrogenedentes bacterium]|nr:lectin-like protein [Candidatus Hydrogenedentota bacterium]